MAGNEDQPQQIVTDVVIHRVQVRLSDGWPRFDVASDFLQLARVASPPAHQVDRAMLRGRHQPGARPVRDALTRPLLERDHQGVLR